MAVRVHMKDNYSISTQYSVCTMRVIKLQQRLRVMVSKSVRTSDRLSVMPYVSQWRKCDDIIGEDS